VGLVSAQEVNYIISGEVSEFELFTSTLVLPDWAQSFDISFISGGNSAMLGTLYVDDISAAIVGPAGSQGDFDADGDVDGRDLLAWQQTLGSTVTPGAGADADHSGTIDAGDLAIWRSTFNSSALQNLAAGGAVSIPEPFPLVMALSCWLLLTLRALEAQSSPGVSVFLISRR
jgi:hypothetical protein